MEIICAGYPKTGSKTCSAALKILGYNVADYVETADDLVFEWNDFFQGKTSFKPVIEKYKKCGYNVNQDVPGNLKWKNLYDFSPDAKVILTVRDNVDKWKESVNGYMHQEYSRLGNPGYFFLSRMMNFGLMGQKLHLMEKLAFQAFDDVMETKRPKKTFYTWQAHCEFSQTRTDELAKCYLKHIEEVKRLVPPEKLLIWNVKEGWEPLCNFLNKPIPSEELPRENKTGDKEYLEQYYYQSNLYKTSMAFATNYCYMLILFILIIISIICVFCKIYGII